MNLFTPFRNYQKRSVESSKLGLSSLHLTFCLSGSKLQTVRDCGQEEVHATILHGSEPVRAEPTTGHRGGLRSNASWVASAVRQSICNETFFVCSSSEALFSLPSFSHPFHFPLRYDFYLISQAACQGTVNPTYYNVIYDDNGLKPDHMQRLTFKLCHLYYNWAVSDSCILMWVLTLRVPIQELSSNSCLYSYLLTSCRRNE